MLITHRVFHQGPPYSRAPLQRLEERYHRRPICRREPLEPVACSGAFPAVQLDRLLEAAGTPVVEEGLGVTQVEERLGAEILRRGAAEADVRQLRAPVGQPQVRVGGGARV